MQTSVPDTKLKAVWTALGVSLLMLITACPVFCDETTPAAPDAAPSAETTRQNYRATHLPWAVVDNPEMVPELIKNGADVNAMDEDGRTSVHYAAFYNRYGIAKLLLENGANVNVKEHSKEPGFWGWGWYPLHLALRNKNREMIRLLVDHGADVNAKRADGWTPMFTAAWHGQPDVIELLISKGADVRVGNGEPLRLAVSQDKIEAAKVMIKHGADVNAANGAGQTALHIAVRDNIAAVRFLLENKAKVDLADNEGRAPLYHAAYAGNVDIVKLLISKGADVKVRTKAGESLVQALVAGKKHHLSDRQASDPTKRDWNGVRSVLLRHGVKE